ncbi:retrotransposon protein, putative, ty1-copia subclass [Tanacetum coccineum]
MFEEQAKHELFETVKAFHACKQEEGQSVSSYLLKMKSYLDTLERLGYEMPNELGVSLILNSLNKDYDQFIQNYNMHSIRKTLAELHAMLKLHEKEGQKEEIVRGKGKAKGNNKLAYAPKTKIPPPPKIDNLAKDSICYHCKEGLRESKKLKHEALSLYMGNGMRATVEAIRSFDLILPTRILNMVPTKKVDRTPYEIWHGKAPKLSYLRVWGCYPKETMGYYFYYPLKNINFVSRNTEFFENSFMIQEMNGSHGLLEMSGGDKGIEIRQKKDTQPSENTSKEHNEVSIEVEPENVGVPIRRSARIPQVPYRYGYYIDIKEYELGDLDEPPNYKAALADPESDKWLKAMNTEMQSMKDNQVWYMVDLPSNCRTVGCKWFFKKNTNMDGNVHTFKARLVAKGFTQTYGVDYRETISPVADIRAIRILLAIAAFYDYEIWQMDVKTAFLNGHLSEDQASRSWNKRFDEEIKKIGFSQNPDEPCVYLKASENLGEAAYILGIEIIRDRSNRLIALSQSAYLEKILKKFRMKNSKKGYTPMMEKPDYRKSRFQQNPGEIHWTAVKTILKYLRNTKEMVLIYGAKPEDELKVSCYAGASFQTNKDDTKSQIGYVFILNGGAVDWKSAKQSTTTMSSTEVEYIAAAEA